MMAVFMNTYGICLVVEINLSFLEANIFGYFSLATVTIWMTSFPILCVKSLKRALIICTQVDVMERMC